MPRLHSAPIPIVEGHPLVLGKANILREQIPVGPGGGGWWKLLFKFSFPVTIGTAVGVKPEAGLAIVNGVTFETSRKEKMLDNCPARHIYRDNIIQSGVQEPATDPVAQASATYVTWLEHYFIDRRMRQPLDTLFDASRYAWAKLTLNMGTVADLFTTPGTATINDPTVDIFAFKIHGSIPPGVVKAYRELGVYPPEDPASKLYIDPERDPDLELKRLYVYGTENATDGEALSGDLSDDVIDTMKLSRVSSEGSEELWPETEAELIRRINQPAYQLESEQVGVHIFDFVEAEGSHMRNVKPVGSKFRLDYSYAGGQTDPQVTAAFDGIRTLR
ncbi:MAG TPA: hypothetical protein VEC14_07360 [Reyranellaceae bacterium]|nr:hypothetical protein [Reyranellaceae bacterium]